MSNEATRGTSTGSGSPGWGDHYDPDDVPVRHAATVSILDERPDLHVLMLKRNPRSVFVGDMWVFPGGAVDEHDDVAGETDRSRTDGIEGCLRQHLRRGGRRTDARDGGLFGIEGRGRGDDVRLWSIPRDRMYD